MAKTPEDKGKVKFRFVEFELEGLNSTIEEGIKSIVNSMSRSSSPATRLVAAGKPTRQLTSTPAAGNGHTEAEVEVVEGDVDEENSETRDGSESSRESQSGKPRHYTQPKFLTDLDLDGGPVPFKQFVEEQKPESDNRKYIVCATWLKKYRNLDVITSDHIYTCNQKMGWRTQRDVGQPFRQMKKKSYFDAAGRNKWSITHIGLDQLTAPEE